MSKALEREGVVCNPYLVAGRAVTSSSLDKDYALQNVASDILSIKLNRLNGFPPWEIEAVKLSYAGLQR